MSWRIVDADSGKPAVITNANYPAIIHGAAKSGASFFTVILTAELVRADEAIVFMCAHGEGVQSLRHELGLKKSVVAAREINSRIKPVLESSRLVTLFNKRPDFLQRSLAALSDWRDRTVLINNAETILYPALWDMIKTHQRLVISGDIRGLEGSITYYQFKTAIAFSPWPNSAPYQRGDMPPYIGAMRQGFHGQNLLVTEIK